MATKKYWQVVNLQEVIQKTEEQRMIIMLQILKQQKCYLQIIHLMQLQYQNLTWETDKKFEGIITNPPFSLAQEFEKGMELLTENGQMAMFLKIQFLEGAKRKDLFEKYPPKYIYVFRNRMATWNNGNEVDPKTGKKWATTMCHAWFIWEKDSKTEPIIRWLQR